MNSKVSDPFYKGYVVEFDNGDRILVPEITIPNILSYDRHVVGEDDTLLSIANQYYQGDTTKWYVIAEVNLLKDSISLSVGSIILIPRW